ncbi:hypothetical protein [Streptomyces ossamyceticus]|uniref:Uncharacterized protein n=1 Tax=Streptomyces ossamyceticus TaxID=249581 RepID=A0ABV2V1Y8_9ACTN
MPKPVTTTLSRPIDTDGSSTDATPQNTDATTVKTSVAAIRGCCNGDFSSATMLVHHAHPAARQNTTAAGGNSTGGTHRATSPSPSRCPVRADPHQPYQVQRHLDHDHHPHRDPQRP